MKTHQKPVMQCGICDKVVRDKYRLDQHMETYHTTYCPKCSVCKKSFFSKRMLWDHNKTCGKLGNKAKFAQAVASSTSTNTADIEVDKN